jgi:hypothetical protein
MATYRLKRKTYGIGDVAATAAGSTLGAAGGIADTTTGGIVGGLAAASSSLADMLPGGSVTAGLIGYAATRGAGKVLKNTGESVRDMAD